MKATRMLIATPLLKSYIEHGMDVTKVHEVVELQAQTCFEKFVLEVSDARRPGDQHPDMAIIGETKKFDRKFWIRLTGHGQDATSNNQIRIG